MVKNVLTFFGSIYTHAELKILIESFRLSYYPHRLDEFKCLLQEAFGQSAKHTVYGDFKGLDEIPEPAFYIHLMEKHVE